MVIMITGASRGIGAALAEKMTAAGHTAILVSRNKKALEDVAERCNRNPVNGEARILPFDLTDTDSLETGFRALVREHSPVVDALVNNAGKLINKPFLETEARDARSLFETNVIAPAALIRVISPMMQDSELKHVVNVTSMGGFQGSAKFSGLSYYSASKAALGCLTECLAEELKDEGIRMNALALGAVQTEMLEEAFPGYRVPMQPEGMAEFISWFVLQGGSFFNGKVLPVSLSTP